MQSFKCPAIKVLSFVRVLNSTGGIIWIIIREARCESQAFDFLHCTDWRMENMRRKLRNYDGWYELNAQVAVGRGQVRLFRMWTKNLCRLGWKILRSSERVKTRAMPVDDYLVMRVTCYYYLVMRVTQAIVRSIAVTGVAEQDHSQHAKSRLSSSDLVCSLDRSFSRYIPIRDNLRQR